ncbi:M14 family zinc carboxypeptidase [Parvularcula maris]|uniref:M14 family zinc carboxypeptidase n=1 Tax=Parvularcula maris TaxID=2965077 RepID=A0A9X2RHT8_9PROT|nr:M14 family zinc carboxypeptidase [Parvularcula maris]MCQ8185280.1 M14 family zinc carboxypeptidase [Parvularcula maris]
MRGCLTVLLALFWGTASALPIEAFQLDGVEYDDSIQTPDEFLGYGLGERPIRHDKLVEYLSGLAETSDRMQVETIGYTHEGRPILFFAVSSPENLLNLEEIREFHLAALRGEPVPEEQPAVIWINYGVHGAESAGMDASVPALYHFAAAQGEEIEEQLDDAVVLVVAILNPDGHSRRVDHVETFGGEVPVTDPAHAQHDLWTEARTNHYWFDLNRQWLLLSQPEAQAWVSKWQEWKPQVSADFHEMGSQSTFYFHPGEPKRKNPLIPDQARELTKDIAEYHREFLDSEARLYFTEQGFDNFYIGKGSTYPQVNGGLGILFEVGAARGGAVESPSGERSYADNIRTHFRTTLSTIEGTLAAKDEIEAYQREFFESAATEAQRDATKGYVISAGKDKGRMTRFLNLLSTHDIVAHRLAEPLDVNGQVYEPEDSYVVPLQQPQYLMIRGIFDRVTEFEENIFYDVSGWTLPLAFDLHHAPLKNRVSRGDAAGRYDQDLLGELWEGEEEETRRNLAESSYGYVMPWADRRAPGALYKLLDEGLLARIAREPFEVRTPEGIETFSAGTVFIPFARQEQSEEEIRTLLEEAMNEFGIDVLPVSSGAGDVATASLGGASFEPGREPSVVLPYDGGLARYDVGEVWHLLDHDLNMPVTLVHKDRLGGLDWSRYTHLLMVGGGAQLPQGTADRVGQWIREEGGTLVAMRQAAVWAQNTYLEDGQETSEDEGPEDGRTRLNYAEMGTRDAEHVVAGSIVATDIDTTHPLAFGYTDRDLPSLRNTSLTLTWPEDNPYAVVSAYKPSGSVLLTGYMSERRRGEIAETPAVIAERYGRGAVVLMADNPVFRGFFHGTERLLVNAIFFSNLIDRPSGDYTAVEE